MKIALAALFALSLFLGCESNPISELQYQYELHLEDLSFYSTYGYRNNFEDIDIQGTIRTTDYFLDCAINGLGFFCYSEPNTMQLLYTRNGAIRINEEGFIVNYDGYFLEPRIQISLDEMLNNISIDLNGEIIITESESEKVLGRLHLYNKINNEYQKQGNYFVFSAVEDAYDYKIISGALETSNFSLRSKLYAMLELLYQLKSLDSDNSDCYEFRIHLLNELLISRRESLKNVTMPQNGEMIMQSLYREINETVDFLVFPSPNGI